MTHSIKFLSVKQVTELTTLSRQTIWKLRSENKFPQTIQITEQRSAFIYSEIMDWMQAKADTQRGGGRA